ncbi:YobI family P-loop NTPase [Blastococcus tunisiensis]|nr:hypothetical protein [Blastococcus sp. DSM 46838]
MIDEMNDPKSSRSSPGAAGGAATTSPASTVVSLKSLAPYYVESQHGTYLRRLNEAIVDSRNRNIALTGRYGTGKSSILDRFQEMHEKATLRLAIHTLGPEGDGDSTTNRIQKELVKQLIYSASPKTLRRSTFARWAPLSLRRAGMEAFGIVSLLAVLLALLGWLPDLAGAGEGEPWVQRVALWAAFAVVAVLAMTGLRLLMHGRVISNVSAAGATVSLSERTLTYFDKYLDEIVNYFDAQSPDFVVFEDLDRFGDPHIFEALRELNTLLNSTPKRIEKGKPLRFIYAVRDSLFEKLGSDTKAEGDDAATAETLRANRTKFFDVVIPVVPFISHRNARDLLHDLLADAKITSIDRPLVDLVAQHATDMRLLVNMRNEYLVFAERLLNVHHQAPGLTPSGLFALVAYKNFHLKDFEHISRRGSDLDDLYRYRRDLVRTSVARLDRRKRDLLRGRGRAHARADVAARLSERLRAVGDASKRRSSWPSYKLRYQVGSTGVNAADASNPSFWAAVADTGSVGLQLTPDPDTDGNLFMTLAGEEFAGLFPEALDAGHWASIDEDDLRAEIAKIDQDISFLRGADFSALASADEFELAVQPPTKSPPNSETDTADVAETVHQTFRQLVDRTMKSDLARDLVTRGYLDRNFALYAAQFYGEFTGVDVATFIVQSVQTNTMDIDYRFDSPGAIENLLSETSEDFTHSVSAYNVAVVDFLLEHRRDLADNVVARMVSSFDDQAREFLAAYLSAGKQRSLLAAQLSARGWREVFTYLAKDEDVPDDARVGLVDAALSGAGTQGFDLGSDAADFIGEHYKEMPTFTSAQDDSRVQTIVALVNRADVLVADLSTVHETLRAQLVAHSLYQLTAPNLYTALGAPRTISLDQVREDDVVYEYCLANPGRYLAAVRGDGNTKHTVETADTLRAVLADVAGRWSDEQIDKLISAAAPGSALDSIAGVPSSTLRALAAARLFRASISNMEAYRAEVGAIDENLAQLLLAAGAIEVEPGNEVLEGDEAVPADRVVASLAILNASDAIPAARDRVSLVRSLDIDGPLPPEQLQPEGGELLTLLITEGIVEDDADTFSQFHAAGWSALEPAIVASDYFKGSVAPELVDGMVAQIFDSPKVRDKLGAQIVGRLGEFVPSDDGTALTAAASYAVAQGITLPAHEILRVAATGPEARDVTLRLLQMAPPAAADIVATLVELGEPYRNLSTRQQTEFEVPFDDAHRAVFGQLEEAGLCKTSKKRLQDRLLVKLL